MERVEQLSKNALPVKALEPLQYNGAYTEKGKRFHVEPEHFNEDVMEKLPEEEAQEEE